MTAPGARRTGADVEQELTARLRELARAFIADLTAQAAWWRVAAPRALRN